MTNIRATCPTCGDIRISASKVTIRSRIDQPGGEYRWKCKCGIVVKQADENIMQILRNNGVNEEIWELPLEIMERPIEGTLSEDDIIDLELAFKDGSAFKKITRSE